MLSNQLAERLRESITSADPIAEHERITEELRANVAGLEAVRPILVCMEENPQFDFGSPGPLVHYLEGFYQAGYEAELLASLERRPTALTVWMLNRIINATTEMDARRVLQDTLSAAASHPQADVEVQARVAEFIRRT